MVPGDIYIGKATLIEYEVSYGDFEFGIDPSFEHRKCGNDVELDTELYGTTTPWDYLNAILEHEKMCPSKEKKSEENQKRT